MTSRYIIWHTLLLTITHAKCVLSLKWLFRHKKLGFRTYSWTLDVRFRKILQFFIYLFLSFLLFETLLLFLLVFAERVFEILRVHHLCDLKDCASQIVDLSRLSLASAETCYRKFDYWNSTSLIMRKTYNWKFIKGVRIGLMNGLSLRRVNDYLNP